MVVASSPGQLTEGPAGQPGAMFPLAGEMTQAGHTEELLVAAEREWGAAGAFVASVGCGLPGVFLGTDAAQWPELTEVIDFAQTPRSSPKGCPVIPGGRTTTATALPRLTLGGTPTPRCRVARMSPV